MKFRWLSRPIGATFNDFEFVLLRDFVPEYFSPAKLSRFFSVGFDAAVAANKHNNKTIRNVLNLFYRWRWRNAHIYTPIKCEWERKQQWNKSCFAIISLAKRLASLGTQAMQAVSQYDSIYYWSLSSRGTEQQHIKSNHLIRAKFVCSFSFYRLENCFQLYCNLWRTRTWTTEMRTC